MEIKYSLHKVEAAHNCPFLETDYSRFKFGDVSIAKKFAQELFNGFIAQHKDLVLAQQDILLLPSPYFSIPTASNFLCAFFKENLNYFLFQQGKKACIETKMHRIQSYVDDYGSMSFEARKKLISNDTYYIDKQFIEGKFCIFLDDIKITGTHELTIKKILEKYQVKGSFAFLYYAELMNKNIHPNIENHFNHFAIKSVQDIINIVNSSSFKFNTRIVKYILSLIPEDFQLFVDNTKLIQQQELLKAALSNNYHQTEKYQKNLQYIDSVIHQHQSSKKTKKEILV